MASYDNFDGSEECGDWLKNYFEDRLETLPFSEKKLIESQKTVELLRKQLEASNQRLVNAEDENKQMKEHHAKEIDDLKIRVMELEDPQKEQNLQLTVLKEQNEEVKKMSVELNKVNEELKVTKDEIAKCQDELNERVEEVTRLRVSLQEACSKWIKANLDVEAKQERLDQAEDLLQNQHAHIEVLQNVLGAKDENIMQLEQALASLIFPVEFQGIIGGKMGGVVLQNEQVHGKWN